MSEERGRKVGPLKTLPELEPGDRVYMQAFEDLSARRSYHASGPNPISVHDMRAYYLLHGMPAHVDSQRVFFRLMSLMDDAYISYSIDRRAAEAEQRKKESARR